MKVLLLAPIQVAAGGIHAWAKLLLDEQHDKTIEYLIVDTSVRYRTLGGKTGIREALCGIWDCFARFFAMVQCLLKNKPNLVYFTCAPSIGFAFRDTPLIVLSKLFGRKVIIHLHGGNVEGFWGGNPLKTFMAWLGTRLSDFIFVITRDCEAYARNRFGSKKVIYVPNFIKTDCLDGLEDQRPPEFKKDQFNVIHVAFQCQVKGTFEVIESAKYLPDDVHLSLIGPVAEDKRVAIEAAITKEGVQHKVTLVGPRHKPELWHYYRHADIFLFPTHKKGPEGFPNVIMEAMLCRLPIIATDVGNIAEMVDAGGQTPAALLLKQSDPPEANEIADLIKHLKTDELLRRQMAENGHALISQRYSTDYVISALQKILYAIASKEDVLSVSSGYFLQKT